MITTSTGNILTIASATDNTTITYDVAEYQRQQQERWEMEMQVRQMIAAQEAARKPFDETEEFRDFMVWLCGFTDRDGVPDKESWSRLRSKVEKVAAKFATRALDPPQEQKNPLQNQLWTTGTYAVK
jgi:hypothetical protein